MSPGVRLRGLSHEDTFVRLTSMQVSNVFFPLDKETRRPRGFGFVDIVGGAPEAKKVIDSLNEKDLMGRTISVKLAEPRQPRQGSTSLASNGVSVRKVDSDDVGSIG